MPNPFLLTKMEWISKWKDQEKGDQMPKSKPVFPEFLPEEVWKWKLIEERFDHILKLHDYHEIRLPILLDREFVERGIKALMQGRQGKMLAARTVNVCDEKSETSSFSLRPEGTISILGLAAREGEGGRVHRYYYHGPFFRMGEGPQESIQLGVELLGSNSPISENEVISLGIRLLKELGFRDISLRLNSFGCEDCRRKYLATVRAELKKHSDSYCEACHAELAANPFSQTQCDDPRCPKDVPEGLTILDYLCPACLAALENVKKVQANLGHAYKLDPRLTKNYAYYNGTVFDFVVGEGESQQTVGGGGRYDRLSDKLVKRSIPGVGFFLDLDLIFNIMDTRRLFFAWDNAFSVYVCALSPGLEMMLLQIAQELHEADIVTVVSPEIRDSESEQLHAKDHDCDLMLAISEDSVRMGKLELFNLIRANQSSIPLNRVTDSVQISRKLLRK